MMRLALMRSGVCGVVLLCAIQLFGVHLASAQQDGSAPGRSQMTGNNEAIGVLVTMAKGDKPYDQAAVDAALARLDECAKKLPTLYPESLRGTQADTRFSPSPKVWDDKAGFAAQISSFGAAVVDAKSKTRDIEGLKGAVNAIGKECGDCHQNYRIRNG